MTKQDMITAPVAVGALAWPRIHNWIEWLATEAQLVLPVLGAVWLLVQIAAKIHSTWFKERS
ncbi:hypothetical protein [Roseibium aggregatum]|uniref:Uncharacterized protein n=1 Tax=Roseibium aggregatum TaxID=187304 RepID=A0A939J4Z4_9HYPH|nr:hypothetical protein [Roseibium aggregatum]MBN9671685.1 hypothetical protein [Roseibium aggregatum]